MDGPASERPQLNSYGKITVGCVLASIVTPLVGGPGSLSAGLLGVGVVVLIVAMRKNARTDERTHSDDDGTGTDDRDMEAKGMVGGEGGQGGL